MIEYSQKIIDKAIKGEQKRGRVTRKRIEEKHLRNERKKAPFSATYAKSKSFEAIMASKRVCLSSNTVYAQMSAGEIFTDNYK